MSAPLSVIIPTLDAAEALPETANALLAGVTDGLIRELVISDGGSEDETLTIAKELGAVIVSGAPGREGQIARGVAASSGQWLMILNPDAHLSEGWSNAARAHMNAHPERAGWFRLRFRDSGIAPAIVAFGANLKARILGLPCGEQGLLVSRTCLGHAGGFAGTPPTHAVTLKRLRGCLRPLDAEALAPAKHHLGNR